MDKMHETLRDFAKSYTDYIPEIAKLDHIPSALEFYSDYVMPNKPFVIDCEEGRLPAIERFQEVFYLEKTLLHTFIDIYVKPFNVADQFIEDRFVEPEIRCMDIYDLLLEYKFKETEESYFIDKRNNIGDFEKIANDIISHVPFATEALGTRPAEARISIGNDDLYTSMHYDQYDNFFYVLRGSKRFTLIPPIGHACIPYKTYKKYQWLKNEETDSLKMVDLEEEVELIPPVIEPDTLEQNGFYRNIKHYVVEIKAGEILYIPGLWFHDHRQSMDCITLNFMYELKWDLRFMFLSFLKKLFKVKKPSMYKDVSVDTQSELEESLIQDLFVELEAATKLRKRKT